MLDAIIKGFNAIDPFLFGRKEDKANNVEAMQGFFPWLITPMGEGKNAVSPLQLGMSGLGLYAQHEQNKNQLALAREGLNWQKSNDLANAINQATLPALKLNNLVEARIGFHGKDSEEAKNAYANANAALTQMNNALTNMGGQDSLRPQMNVLQRYSSLA